MDFQALPYLYLHCRWLLDVGPAWCTLLDAAETDSLNL
jgi:hypothetical protein